MEKLNPQKKLIINSAFIVICAGILIFLFKAPQETTAHLPHDENHNRFFAIQDKKDAERFCLDCHASDKEAPLAEGHPPKYRCLFCHKRQ